MTYFFEKNLDEIIEGFTDESNMKSFFGLFYYVRTKNTYSEIHYAFNRKDNLFHTRILLDNGFKSIIWKFQNNIDESENFKFGWKKKYIRRSITDMLIRIEQREYDKKYIYTLLEEADEK